ncbi:MAG TPA: peptidase M23 [Gammaproteobacteria bacterium]|nr:peptidase M23 [Gammaproteobacteria bacterium]
MRGVVAVWVFLAGLLLAFPGQADRAGAGQDAEARARELARLRAEIRSVQTRLDAQRSRKSREEDALRRIDRAIGDSGRGLRDTRRRIRELREDVSRIEATLARERENLSAQRNGLVAGLRAAYVMGRQQQIKLLLNQERPDAIGRVMVYHAYFARAHARRMAAIRVAMRRLEGLRDRRRSRLQRLAVLAREQNGQLRQLEAQKRRRAEVVKALQAQLEREGGQLRRLQADEERLADLLRSLRDLLADIPADANLDAPFPSRRGTLVWPASGKLAARFGDRRPGAGRWQGVLIAAPEGGEVRAVAQGRVAFADWMRGFGLLLIIDHGDGYMSLYGYNQSLYKEVGEWVDTGEVVATLGASGGQSRSGLYFELRHKGRPVDPAKWCRGRPLRADARDAGFDPGLPGYGMVGTAKTGRGPYRLARLSPGR